MNSKRLFVIFFAMFLVVSQGCKKKEKEEPEPKPTVYDCSKWEKITEPGPLTAEIGKVMVVLIGRERLGKLSLYDDRFSDRTRLTSAHICALNEALEKKLFKEVDGVFSFEKDKNLYQFILIENASLGFRITGPLSGGTGLVVDIRWIPTW